MPNCHTTLTSDYKPRDMVEGGKKPVAYLFGIPFIHPPARRFLLGLSFHRPRREPDRYFQSRGSAWTGAGHARAGT